jgi:hypothetical protein
MKKQKREMWETTMQEEEREMRREYRRPQKEYQLR